MNLYQLKEALLRQEKAVFTLAEISRISGVKKRNIPVYMHRMKKKNLLFSVEKNKFSVTDDPFIVASQLINPAYLSLTTALYLHNLLPQVIDKIEVLTSRRKKEITLFGMKTNFRMLSPSRMFGYNKIKKGKSYLMLAEVEKAIIDSIYFQKSCPLHLILPVLAKTNTLKLERYAQRFAHEGVLRRLGYLLDYAGIAHHLQRKSNRVYMLNPASKKKGTFNKKWFLYVNEVL